MAKLIGTLLGVIGALAYMGAIVLSIAAWITHVVFCIKTAAWIMLFFGAFFFPIGIIHGVGLWLGVF